MNDSSEYDLLEIFRNLKPTEFHALWFLKQMYINTGKPVWYIDTSLIGELEEKGLLFKDVDGWSMTDLALRLFGLNQ